MGITVRGEFEVKFLNVLCLGNNVLYILKYLNLVRSFLVQLICTFCCFQEIRVLNPLSSIACNHELLQKKKKKKKKEEFQLNLIYKLDYQKILLLLLFFKIWFLYQKINVSFLLKISIDLSNFFLMNIDLSNLEAVWFEFFDNSILCFHIS